jgi:hypothetical protein
MQLLISILPVVYSRDLLVKQSRDECTVYPTRKENGYSGSSLVSASDFVVERENIP